jgi:hypothetical protein
MGNMILGACTFGKNPSELDTLIRQIKDFSSILTYATVACFDWGARIAGKQLELQSRNS